MYLVFPKVFSSIQCDDVIECRRPDIVVVLKKEKECKIIDIAIPGDCRIGIKETEKVEKYDELKREIRKVWAMKKIEVIPIVVGALGAVSNELDKWIKKLGIHIRIELLQKQLVTARILRMSLGKLKSLGSEATGCSQLPKKNIASIRTKL